MKPRYWINHKPETNAKSASLLSIGLALILLVGRCKKCAIFNDNLYPNSWSWITYNNSQVIFENQDGDTALFTYSLADDQVIDEGTYSSSERCEHDYSEQSFCDLTSSSVAVKFYFSLVGYREYNYFGITDHGHTFISFDQSALSFDLGQGGGFSSTETNYFDQIILDSIQYQDVYHKDFGDSSCYTVYDFYFTKQSGIIAFTSKDSDLWVLH